MGSQLHLCPGRLRGHAVTAIALADELRAAIDRPVAAGPVSDRLSRAVRRVAEEVAELGTALVDAAGAADRADRACADRFRRLSRTSWSGPR
ncbi:MAG TPA: hypothetical protein VNA11_10525 [Pseudonocardia sp.]|nr:hypothetical protein [Pseudonocardia sp.]